MAIGIEFLLDHGIVNLLHESFVGDESLVSQLGERLGTVVVHVPPLSQSVADVSWGSFEESWDHQMSEIEPSLLLKGVKTQQRVLCLSIAQYLIQISVKLSLGSTLLLLVWNHKLFAHLIQVKHPCIGFVDPGIYPGADLLK